MSVNRDKKDILFSVKTLCIICHVNDKLGTPIQAAHIVSFTMKQNVLQDSGGQEFTLDCGGEGIHHKKVKLDQTSKKKQV